jgi:hypothetical protein
LTKTINEDGSFSFDVSGLTPPFLLKATGTVGSTAYTLHSFANGAGTANVNPFANLVVAMASGGLDPATIYAAPSAGIMQTITGKLSATITDVQTKLQILLALYDAAKIDPVASNFTANHTGLDEVLDMVSVDLSTGVITIRNKTTNAVIFTTQVSNFAGGVLNPGLIPPPPVRAVISPIFVSVPLSKSVTFTADVLRSTNKSVTWSVIESGGGTITNAGVYTAPATEGTYHVKVTSVANPTLPAIAIVKVIPYNVIVGVTPASATVASGVSKTFSATVTGTSNTQVTWSVLEASSGSITSSGVYTAPATAGTYHVTATSVADPAKSATVAVTVTPAVVSISPTSASMTTGGSTTFTATVTGASNTAVTWSVVEVGGGYITSSGVYTASSTVGTYHVKATSVADTTKSATAIITVSAPTPFPIGTWVGPNGFKFTVSQLIVSGLVNQYSGIIYYPSLLGSSMNVSGTDTMIQIFGSVTGNFAQLSVGGGQVAIPNYTDIQVSLTGVPTSTTLSGFVSINSSNSAYNYLSSNAVFTKQ